MELHVKVVQAVHFAGEIAFNFLEQVVHLRHFPEAGSELRTGAAFAFAVFTVKDETLDFFIVILFDQGLFDQILNVFHMQLHPEFDIFVQGCFDGINHLIQFVGRKSALHARERALDDAGDLRALIRLNAAIAFDNVHCHRNPF